MDDLDLGSTLKGFIAGQKVLGRYTLQRILGRGGMGVVWLARDEELEREVAIKFLPEVVASDREAVKELKRETRRSLELTHPHIIRIYDFLQDARTAAISMEYIAGDTLSARKSDGERGCFEPDEIAAWVGQLCSALDYAHGVAQIVHRDLKPANLMVDARGHLRIADFGIASSISESVSRVSRQAGTSGTPVYMSPQQMMGEKPAVSDDIYALGATLFDLLTGKPPFYSGNILMQVQGKVPPTLAARRTELGRAGAPIPAAWESTIAACLAKDPADRPRSAGEVAERLGLSAGGRGTAGGGRTTEGARPGPAAVPAVPRPSTNADGDGAGASRTASKAPLVAGVAAAVLAVAGLGWYFGLHAPEQRRIERERVAAQKAQQEQTLREAKRLQEERDRAAAEARTKAEAEQRTFAEIAARIETLVDGSPAALRDSIDGAVTAYVAAASERFRGEAEARWTARQAAWAAARQAAARGGLTVRTVPAGAEVRVGAIALEQSPFTLKDQRLGKYPVRIRLDGYEDWSGEVEVKDNEFTDLAVALVRSTGTLVLTGEPAGVAVEVVGRAVSGQPPPGPRQEVPTPAELRLPTGGYDLMFRRPGWPDERRSVEVTRNESVSAGAEFLAGSIELTSAPPGAEVWRDGQRIGTTPFAVSDAIPGTYAYELRLRGHHAAKASLEVVPGRESKRTVALERILGPEEGKAFRIPGLDLDLVPLAPGTFRMGSAEGDWADERPATAVTISRPFWLGKTEVTQAQWQALMGGTPSRFVGPNLPVERVTWDQANEYCRKLTERERAAGRLPEGYAYTLPTEAQWEYACRAGTTGNYAGELDALAWYKGNSGGSTKPVGQKQPNAWGLHDMHGNVWEWCLDWKGPYPGGSVTDPTGPQAGEGRIYRGGSFENRDDGWGNTDGQCRSAYRSWWAPQYVNADLRGLRVALSPVGR